MLECGDPLSEASATIQDNPNWRRHKGACANYRERWSVGAETGDEGCRLLYQIVCLMGTPPETVEEQRQCMAATRGCWRLTAGHPTDAVEDGDSSASPRRASHKRSRYASSIP
jgi:hypothetical protein